MDMERSAAKSFRDLLAWQEGHAFVLAVYRMSGSFPKSEMYGLTSQLRRAAVSVCANIAEGFRRAGDADTVKFMNYAQGSLEECRYFLILAEDLGYAKTSELESKVENVSRLVNRYANAVRKNMRRGV
jgi:four helix bundle protein